MYYIKVAQMLHDIGINKPGIYVPVSRDAMLNITKILCTYANITRIDNAILH